MGESEEKTHSMPGVPLSMTSTHLPGFGPISAKLSMALPNIAPDVDLYPPSLPPPVAAGDAASSGYQGSAADAGMPSISVHGQPEDDGQPKKKKYAKEAWPGKKPGQHLLV